MERYSDVIPEECMYPASSHCLCKYVTVAVIATCHALSVHREDVIFHEADRSELNPLVSESWPYKSSQTNSYRITRVLIYKTKYSLHAHKT